MKVAFIYGAWSIGTRPFDLFGENLTISTRGLTGSELALFSLADEFVKLTHDVFLFSVFVPGTKPTQYHGIKLYHIQEINIIDESFDVVVSINEPDCLKSVPSSCLRVVCEYLNDWTFCQPGFDDVVDLWITCSDKLKEHLINQLSTHADKNKWYVVPLGCDPKLYFDNKKIKNRVVSISSPDRGLHLTLQQWSKIRQVVPDVEFHVYYHLDNGPLETYEPNETHRHPNVLRLAQRVRYIKHAIKKLEPFGVKHIGSASRVQVANALSEATVAICPLSTVVWSEGFSVATLETMAAGCFPIIGGIDCLPDIYGKFAPLVPAPVEDHLEEFTNLIVRGLTDDKYRQEVTQKCKAFASELTWENSAKQLEKVITSHPKFLKQESVYEIDEKKDQMIKLNIGSGPSVFPGWTNLDREDVSSYLKFLMVASFEGMPPQQVELTKKLRAAGEVDFRVHDIVNGVPYPDNSVDRIYLGQIVEHLSPRHQFPALMKECYRALRPGGIMRITTPDLDLLIQAYLNNEMDKFNNDQPAWYKDLLPSEKLAMIMYGSGNDERWNNYSGHMFLYTKYSMKKSLESFGFKNIKCYSQANESDDLIMKNEVIDEGMSHSFACDATK